MKVILSLTLAVGALSLAEQASVTPVQKVVSMLEDMHTKGKSEMDAEAKTHEEYLAWERDALSKQHYIIKNANRAIEKQSAIISQSSSNSDQEADTMDATSADISNLKEEMAADAKACDEANKEYLATAADYTEAIDAFTRALTVLKTQNVDRAQSMLLQLSDSIASLPTSLERSTLMNYLSGNVEVPEKKALLSTGTEEEDGPGGAPQAAAYAKTGSRIIGMLTDMKEKAVSEKNDLDMGAKNQQHACAMMAQDKSSELSSKETDLDRATVAKAEADKENAAAQEAFNEATNTLKEAKDTKAEIEKTGTIKKAQFNENQKLRSGELNALQQAIDIIKQGVQGKANKHFGSFAQLRSVLKSAANMMSVPAKMELFGFIQGKAAKLNSEALGLLAVKLSSNNPDPFVKIRGMISDLVAKLEAEAKKEAEDHSWCQAKLSENKKQRESLESNVERLQAEIESSSSKISAHAEDMKEQSATMADLTAEMGAATEIRTKESAENKQTIKDSKEAQEAINQALQVLKDFYAGAKDAMANTAATTAGQQEGASGVVGMIEVLQTDFARLQADTEAEESKAAAEYDSMMSRSKAQHEQTREDNVASEAKKTAEENRLRRKKKDLKNTNEQLKNANDANAGLQETCVATKLSYEERVALREQEISSLQEALAMLEGEDKE